MFVLLELAALCYHFEAASVVMFFFRETVKKEQQICNSMLSRDLLLKLATCAVQTVARKSPAI